jgi:hypothetical protein
MTQTPDRIYAWVYRDGDRMLASCICAVSPCGPFQTEYVRADLAIPLDDPRVEALVDLIKRAEHNIPKYYTLWHSDARAALIALEGNELDEPLHSHTWNPPTNFGSKEE